METDFLIVGCGCSGLYCALHLPENKRITIVTKSDAKSSDSFLAQGGMCMLRDEADYNNYFEDTMRAGHYENDRMSVEIMIRSSKAVAEELIGYGVEFQRDKDGGLAFTREGAHSDKRILFHKDITGKEITGKLLERVRRLPNVEILEHTRMLDLISQNQVCRGAVIKRPDGSIEAVRAQRVVLATGGIGGLYRHSTNFRHLTGDGLAVAIRHGVQVKDLDYIQIHPTTLYSDKPGERRFLISESVRGEGAKLYDKDGKRFVDELLPRDLLTEAILKQMQKDGTDYVWEDLRTIPEKELKEHFPNIVEHCAQRGYDVRKECIPVVPAQHYFMGGIKIDYSGRTSMEGLYAVGETACNGVHGRNRLASNSLLESLVFAKRAAQDIAESTAVTVDLKQYQKEAVLDAAYQKLVLQEIKKAEAGHGGIHRMYDQTTLKLNADPLILGALREDITSEDVTTNSVMPIHKLGEAKLLCKEDGIICGLQVFERVFTLLDETVEIEFMVSDGDMVTKGQLLAKIKGDIRTILSGERTALNYLQRMSGIATYTHSVASLLEGSKTKLLDTRKTTPNNRIFEKYAVRVGGGNNHRFNLSDGVLLKDNHIGAAGGVKEAVTMAKAYAPFVRKIEVEVENTNMAAEAVKAGADIIMLDNMNIEEMKEAVRIIAGRAEVEISGNVTRETVAQLMGLGVDYISSGALTHSAPILDISLKNLHAV